MTINYPVNHSFFRLSSSTDELQKGQVPMKLNPEVLFLMVSLEKMVEEMIQAIFKQLKAVPEGGSKASQHQTFAPHETIIRLLQTFKAVIGAVFHFMNGGKTESLPKVSLGNEQFSRFQKVEERFNPFNPAINPQPEREEQKKSIFSIPQPEIKEKKTPKEEIQGRQQDHIPKTGNNRAEFQENSEKIDKSVKKEETSFGNTGSQTDAKIEKNISMELVFEPQVLEEHFISQHSTILEQRETNRSEPQLMQKLRQEEKCSVSREVGSSSEEKKQLPESYFQKNPVQMGNAFIGMVSLPPQENAPIQPNMTPQINLFAKSDVAIERRGQRKKKKKKPLFEGFREDLEK